jgi:hypothetical protein
MKHYYREDTPTRAANEWSSSKLDQTQLYSIQNSSELKPCEVKDWAIKFASYSAWASPESISSYEKR